MVANGELGGVNDTQAQCLIDAISVCDSMQRLISDMLQLERLQAGRTRARRDWFELRPSAFKSAARSTHCCVLAACDSYLMGSNLRPRWCS